MRRATFLLLLFVAGCGAWPEPRADAVLHVRGARWYLRGGSPARVWLEPLPPLVFDDDRAAEVWLRSGGRVVLRR